MRFYSSDIDKSKDHSGPCWPSDPCARCMGYPESEILDLEKSRQDKVEEAFLRADYRTARKGNPRKDSCKTRGLHSRLRIPQETTCDEKGG
jgi:hypothetical protein